MTCQCPLCRARAKNEELRAEVERLKAVVAKLEDEIDGMLAGKPEP